MIESYPFGPNPAKYGPDDDNIPSSELIQVVPLVVINELTGDSDTSMAVVDPASDKTVISGGIIKELRLRPSGFETVLDLAGARRLPMFKVKLQIQLASESGIFIEKSVEVIGNSHAKKFALIGRDLLEKAIIKIDMSENILTLEV